MTLSTCFLAAAAAPAAAPSAPVPAAAVAALGLALVHVATPRLRFLGGIPRSIWLSLFGGAAVAYVFVHLLPELAAAQEHVARAARAQGIADAGVVALGERHIYLIALVGLVAFHGLDRMAKRSRSQREGAMVPGGRGADGEDAVTSIPVFWIHMGSFGVYNLLVGYLLLHREASGVASLVLFALAMGLHLFVTDYGLNADHQAPFRRRGRWILAAAVVGGFLVGATVTVSQAAVAILLALLAGGVVLNVLKEEVPAERQSRFWAFAAGAAAYTVLLLTV